MNLPVNDDRHARFAELHHDGTFVIMNVFDAGSAVLAEQAGVTALATTSSGHARSIGRDDGIGDVTRDASLERLSQLVSVVRIPVSVDAENGWADDPDGVAESIRLLRQAGASGATIEDWSCTTDGFLYDTALAVERVAAAVEAANSLPDPFVVCARAEVFLRTPTGAATSAEMLEEAITRLQAFAAAGAHCLYAPGLRDIDTIASVVANAGGPVNALIGYGSELTVADAASVGVRRISVGGSLYNATSGYLRHLVSRTLDEGRFDIDHPAVGGDEFNRLFSRGRAGGAV